MPKRGWKMPNNVKSKISNGLKRRQSEGLPIGQPRKKPIHRYVCQVCGKFVIDKARDERKIVCSLSCASKMGQRKKKPRPNSRVVVESYLAGCRVNDLAARYKVNAQIIYEILRSEKCPLVQRGNNGRPKITTCIETGCSKPAFKVWHSTGQRWWGVRCVEHAKAKRQAYYKRKLQNADK